LPCNPVTFFSFPFFVYRIKKNVCNLSHLIHTILGIGLNPEEYYHSTLPLRLGVRLNRIQMHTLLIFSYKSIMKFYFYLIKVYSKKMIIIYDKINIQLHTLKRVKIDMLMYVLMTQNESVCC